MDVNGAIKVLREHNDEVDGLCECKYCKAAAIAIEALEKQIPKDMNWIEEDVFECSCGEELNSGYGWKYCPNCGQAICWDCLIP